MHFTRRRSVLVATLLLVLSITAVQPTRQTSAATAGSLYVDRTARASGAVAVVGDSLTYAYWSALPAAFAAEAWGPFALEARSARRTLVTESIATSGVDAIRRIRATGFDPSLWIIALGTNDMNITFRTPGATEALVDALLAELGDNHRVVWVNVYARDYPAQTRAFNDALERSAARHRNLVVADWNRLVTAHPDWIGADGIHPTLDGARARNAWVATLGFSRFCSAPPVPVVPVTVVASLDQTGASATSHAVRLCTASP